jgi:hypothetical protein
MFWRHEHIYGNKKEKYARVWVRRKNKTKLSLNYSYINNLTFLGNLCNQRHIQASKTIGGKTTGQSHLLPTAP